MTGSLPTHLPSADWQRHDGLSVLCDALGARQGEARFVGGAVRDGLLGLPVKDIDIATVHLPEQVIERVKAAGFKAVPTGLAHGTITAVVNHRPVEITSLRQDVSTDGRRATVAFGTDWEADAARRDFTMNALYADPVDGQLFDYFGGRDDLANRHVRFIGDPHARIAEDHLRILRFFRFTARFGDIDRQSADYQACLAHAASLMALSRERIADELLKLLGLPDPHIVVTAMIEDGIMARIMPEIRPDAADALKGLIAAERQTGLAPDGLRRLMALLPCDALIVEQVAARLRLSNKARLRLSAATHATDEQSAFACAYRHGVEMMIDRILLGRTHDLNMVALLRNWIVPRFPLSGSALIAMGLPPGPQVSRALKQIERLWIAADFPDAEAVRALADQALGETLRSSQ